VSRRKTGPYGPLLREIISGEPLTAREVEVLLWAARGKTAEETAAEIFIATETVRSYRKRVSAKLSADSLAHAVALALRDGIVSIEEVFGDGPS
jgi:DNA-binding CsgD family transcriptional regulator